MSKTQIWPIICKNLETVREMYRVSIIGNGIWAFVRYQNRCRLSDLERRNTYRYCAYSTEFGPFWTIRKKWLKRRSHRLMSSAEMYTSPKYLVFTVFRHVWLMARFSEITENVQRSRGTTCQKSHTGFRLVPKLVTLNGGSWASYLVQCNTFVHSAFLKESRSYAM